MRNGATSGFEMLAARYIFKRFRRSSHPIAQHEQQVEAEEGRAADEDAEADRRGLARGAAAFRAQLPHGASKIGAHRLGASAAASVKLPVATTAHLP